MIIDEARNRSVQSDYALALTLVAMQVSNRIRLVLMSATGDHDLVKNRIPKCQKAVLSGTMQKIRQIFLSQPIQHSDHLLVNVAHVITARHHERAGLPLVDHASRSEKGGNPSNKFMVFVPGVPLVKQLHEILHRALDVGWTWGLISLEFHGQSSKKENALA